MENFQNKIGIMGGTFDPIHTGHLIVAETAREEYGLDKIIFIPSGNPPHKQRINITSSLHRYIMTVMATCSNPHFSVSSIEMEQTRTSFSYTIDTMRKLIEYYGAKTKLYFIIGADALEDLADWKDIGDLLKLCPFIVAARPGCTGRINDAFKRLGVDEGKLIRHLAVPEIEISSTDIRERVKTGRSIKYIVPESVENYIRKQDLYRK